ncbi:hypothetical protein CLV40_111199 [Actinokineospora auranticolor]|uniref:Uncharacterized protein n=1 Tax=Actinokineospora auranticolor TaxID=155976 RepID=A0A2S6GLZ0_9PSEU|nr:hypothetical protein CLV40_111199 [Actinokineospora auranticolor]
MVPTAEQSRSHPGWEDHPRSSTTTDRHATTCLAAWRWGTFRSAGLDLGRLHAVRPGHPVQPYGLCGMPITHTWEHPPAIPSGHCADCCVALMRFLLPVERHYTTPTRIPPPS